MNPRHYTTLMLALVAIGMALAGLAVFIVNPYYVLHDRELDGFNRMKPALDRHAVVYKGYLIERIQPNILILGNSRSQVGFDSRHPAFTGKAVANAALTGANLTEALRFYRHAVAVARPELVIIGIDPSAFVSTAERQQLDEAGIGLVKPAWSQAWQHLKMHLNWEALLDAWRTIAWQSRPEKFHYGPEEFGNSSIPYMTQTIIGDGGSGRASRSQLRKIKEPLDTTPLYQAARANLALLEQTALDACRRGIHMKLVVPPLHILMVEKWHREQGGEMLAWWFKSLQKTVDSVDRQCDGPQPELWSAYSYNPITAEALPPPSAGVALMRNYWEISHFKRELGDKVLNVVMGLADAETSDIPVTRLDNGKLDAYLAELEAGRALYLAQIQQALKP